MSAAKQLEFKSIRRAVYLRLSESEYKEFQELCKERGQSAQSFLKSCLFNEGSKRPLFQKTDTDKLLSAISRIGNNVNQIARKMNSGFREDWHDVFENCAKDISKIKHQLVSHVLY